MNAANGGHDRPAKFLSALHDDEQSLRADVGKQFLGNCGVAAEINHVIKKSRRQCSGFGIGNFARAVHFRFTVGDDERLAVTLESLALLLDIGVLDAGRPAR